MLNGLTQLESDVENVAAQQGWTDETVGNIAYGFLINAAPEEVRQDFLRYVLDIQSTENAGMDESDYSEDDEEPVDDEDADL